MFWFVHQSCPEHGRGCSPQLVPSISSSGRRLLIWLSIIAPSSMYVVRADDVPGSIEKLASSAVFLTSLSGEIASC
jgi:hypothetical protein